MPLSPGGLSKDHVMTDAGTDAGRPLRHPDSLAILLLQLAIRIESLVDSHVDQMDWRSFGKMPLSRFPVFPLGYIVSSYYFTHRAGFRSITQLVRRAEISAR